jgi:hypothetical protein
MKELLKQWQAVAVDDSNAHREAARTHRRDRQQRLGRVWGKLRRRMERAQAHGHPEPRELLHLTAGQGSLTRGTYDMLAKRLALRSPIVGESAL